VKLKELIVCKSCLQQFSLCKGILIENVFVCYDCLAAVLTDTAQKRFSGLLKLLVEPGICNSCKKEYIQENLVLSISFAWKCKHCVQKEIERRT